MTQVLPMPGPVEIKPLDVKNPEIFWKLIDQAGFLKDRDYYEQALERHENGEMQVILATTLGQTVGYCLLNWQPKYAYFRLHEIPEIQDLNVLRDHRKQGIGRAMITYCEETARARGYTQMGIGVGLNTSFGSAQKLYITMGYMPDGNGVTYDRKIVVAGEFKPIDENLSLMMIKTLK